MLAHTGCHPRWKVARQVTVAAILAHHAISGLGAAVARASVERLCPAPKPISIPTLGAPGVHSAAIAYIHAAAHVIRRTPCTIAALVTALAMDTRLNTHPTDNLDIHNKAILHMGHRHCMADTHRNTHHILTSKASLHSQGCNITSHDRQDSLVSDHLTPAATRHSAGALHKEAEEAILLIFHGHQVTG